MNPSAWRTPEWEADYAATLKLDSELAQAMLDMGLPSSAAGMIVAGGSAEDDKTPFDPTVSPVTY